jgi:hypothetical protein
MAGRIRNALGSLWRDYLPSENVVGDAIPPSAPCEGGSYVYSKQSSPLEADEENGEARFEKRKYWSGRVILITNIMSTFTIGASS